MNLTLQSIDFDDEPNSMRNLSDDDLFKKIIDLDDLQEDENLYNSISVKI